MQTPAPDESKAGAAVAGNAIVRPFAGTDNPRQLRALEALLAGPVMREQLDRIAGASNSPAVIAELRAFGLELPCDRVECKDRDGRACRPGRYRLTEQDRERVSAWIAKQGMEAHA